MSKPTSKHKPPEMDIHDTRRELERQKGLTKAVAISLGIVIAYLMLNTVINC